MQAQRKTGFRTIDASDFLLPEPARRKRIEPEATGARVVEDAVFEVIGSQPARPIRINDNPPPRHKSSSPEILPLTTHIAVGTIALIERQLLKLSAPAFSTILVSVFFAVFWLCGGFSALSPAKVAGAPAAPFTIGKISVASQDANGMKVVSVSGTLTNQSAVTRAMPLLRVMTRDGETTFGTIVPALHKIQPSGSIRFSGRFKLAGGKLGDIAIIPETP